jgi:hypothetical protein
MRGLDLGLCLIDEVDEMLEWGRLILFFVALLVITVGA